MEASASAPSSALKPCQLETDRQTFRDLFFTLDTETGTRSITGLETPFVHICSTVLINVGIVQTKIDTTVKSNVGARAEPANAPRIATAAKVFFIISFPSSKKMSFGNLKAVETCFAVWNFPTTYPNPVSNLRRLFRKFVYLFNNNQKNTHQPLTLYFIDN